MTHVSHTAHFAPGDTFPHILEDLACPACGRQDPQVLRCGITENRIRLFCDCCGAFITFVLDDAQAGALGRLREARPADQ
jgi:hypothetical protein